MRILYQWRLVSKPWAGLEREMVTVAELLAWFGYYLKIVSSPFTKGPCFHTAGGDVGTYIGGL